MIRMKLKGFHAVICSCCLFFAAYSCGDFEDGFVQLFNGKNLNGWEGAAEYWKVEDGAITGETTTGKPLSYHTYLVWKGGTVADFELRCSFRALSGNSGIQYRSRDLGDYVLAGYQCNIMTFKPGHTAILEEMKNGRGGALAHIGERVEIDKEGNIEVVGKLCDPKDVESSVDKRGWNTLTIIARGNRLVHKLNGITVVDVTDKEEGKAATSGIIALQLHSGRPMKVQFRDLVLKKLTDAES